jgi:hypothetical protein
MKSISILSLVLCFLVLGFVHLIPTGSAETPQKEAATPIELGVMTEKQKQHSRLYKRYNSDRKIFDLLKAQDGEVFIYRLAPLRAELSGSPQPTIYDLLKRLTCGSDAVIVGTVKDKTSQITEDRSFIFTDYTLIVEDVLKNNKLAPIHLNSEITVTRPGGTILLNGRKVRALDESIPPLTAGEKYLLLLHHVHATEAYATNGSGETFQLGDNKIRSLQADSLNRVSEEYTPTSLINEVRSFATHNCDESKGGERR